MASNVISTLVMSLICAIILLYLIGFLCQPRKRRTEAFREKFTPLLEGTAANKGSQAGGKPVIFVPVLFFAKRLLFVSILVAANGYLWVQVALLTLMATATVIYTLWYMPLDSRKANLVEVLNECTLLLLTYHLWCFADIVGEPDTRHQLGFFFIATTQGNIAIHLVLMIIETIHQLKLRIRRCLNRRKSRKNVAKKGV